MKHTMKSGLKGNKGADPALIMQKSPNKTEVLRATSGVGQSSTNNLFFCAHCAAVGQMALILLSCLSLENICPVCMN